MGVRQLSRPTCVTRLYAWVDGFCLRTHAVIVVGQLYGDDLQAPLAALETLLDVRAREPLYEGAVVSGVQRAALSLRPACVRHR